MTAEITLPEWDFSPFYPKGHEDPIIKDRLNKATDLAKDLASKYRGKISKGECSSDDILALFVKYEEIYDLVAPISMYSGLLTAKDSQSTEFKAFQADTQERTTKIFNELVFANLELNLLDEEKFNSYLSDAKLSNYHHHLQDVRKFKPYQLTEAEEQMINMKDQYGRRAFGRLYSELTSSWKFDIEIEGEMKTMSGPELRALRMHPDPEVRRNAMKIFFDRYEDNKLVITHIFNSMFKDYYVENQKRRYPSPISRRNMSNEIDDEIVKVLDEATTASYPRLVHRYYKLKKKIIGLDELTLADIYAPLPKVTKKYDWEQTTDLVLKAFYGFDEQFGDIAKKMMEDKRIDAPVGNGKRGGAFCAGASPQEWPWVLVNHTGNIRDVSTLAHELGHAIHSVLGMEQTPLNFGISLVTAEVASVFSEQILSDYFLKHVEMTKEEKIAYISSQLEDAFATSHRQNMFYRFETMAHELIKEKVLSSDEYCDIYKSELEKMFGDSVTIPEEYRWEWSSIPHFLSVHFYVYAYNMSNLLVLGLYGLFLEQGEEFIPKFKKLLAYRSAKSPEDMMTEIGVDIKDPEFWNKGLNYLEKMVDELEELVG
ncbi:MAG: M3 family oligoendopeptidase [Candidatus Heimdallarchaeota archaeon]|nr:M3 family oligoendopeptidase [Candidatus Heimdallarchaeota archaeon]